MPQRFGIKYYCSMPLASVENNSCKITSTMPFDIMQILGKSAAVAPPKVAMKAPVTLAQAAKKGRPCLGSPPIEKKVSFSPMAMSAMKSVKITVQKKPATLMKRPAAIMKKPSAADSSDEEVQLTDEE